MWKQKSSNIKKQKSYDSFDDIFSLALNILSRTDLTVKKLREKLALKTTKYDEIDNVIERLLELELLNDHERAKTIAKGHPAWSKLRLKQAFYEQGVPADISANVLAEIDFEEEKERCLLAYQKAMGYRELTEELRLKLFQSMLRRGFSANTIRSIMDIDED